MPSIYETLLTQLGPEAVNLVSQKLGVDPQTAQQGIEAGLPLLLSALAQNTQTSDGAQSLAGALARDHNGSALQDIPAVLGNYQQGPGSAILNHVLGAQRSQVEQGLSQQAGLDGGALLQMLAPVVLGALGQQQRQQGLDPNGIAQTLQHEQSQFQGGGMLDIVSQLLGGALGGGASQSQGGLAGIVGGGPLTQIVLSVFGPTLIRKIAEVFNIDQRTAQQALMVAVPLLLAALARNTQSQQGADSLHNALTRDHNGSVLGNLDQVLANPQSVAGDKIVKKVLGNNAPSVAQNLTDQTGLDGGQLLQTIAPIVLGVLGQQTQRQGLDANTLAQTLQGEQQTLEQNNGDLSAVIGQVLGGQQQSGGGLLGILGKLLGS